MINSSIYAVFERMWQHVLAKCNNYASIEALNNHIEESNPHGITKEDIGLEKIDNTSDMEKPISYAVQEALDNIAGFGAFEEHTSNMENPHSVTAEQVGALPIDGGFMDGVLTVKGIVLTEGIDYGSGDPSGGVLGQLYFKKVT